MALEIAVVIREDPLKTHRAVEGLRIALGLSTGDNPLTVILLDQAPWLLSEDTEDIVDGDILEKYLPSLQQLKIPFILPSGAHNNFALTPGFTIRESSEGEIAAFLAKSDRVLVF